MEKLEYEAPQVTTYTAEEVLEELGPAQAGEYGVGTNTMG